LQATLVYVSTVDVCIAKIKIIPETLQAQSAKCIFFKPFFAGVRYWHWRFVICGVIL
jgi:hypothetical protein